MGQDEGSKRRNEEVTGENEVLDEPELISDDDILLAEDGEVEYLDDNVEEEETTGKFNVPPEQFSQAQVPTAPGEPQPELDEEAFEEDTSDIEPDLVLDESTPVSVAERAAEDSEPAGSHSDEGSAAPWDEPTDEGADQPAEIEADDVFEEDADDFVPDQEVDYQEDTGRDFVDEIEAADQEGQLEDKALTGADVTDTLDEPGSDSRKSRRRRRRPVDDLADETAEHESGEYSTDEAEPEDQAAWDAEEPDEGGDSGQAQSFPDQTPPDGVKAPWLQDEAEEEVSPDAAGTVPAVDPAFAQSEDPAREKTLIFGDDGQEEAPEFPFLVVIEGEEEGREIELIPDEMSIGRGADNDLVFPDIACSRRHALLERDGDSFCIIDLGSGNGTKVNDERIQRELLYDGDEIKVGSTVLQFNLPGAVPADDSHRADGTVTNALPVADGTKTGFISDLMADPQKRKLVLFGGGGLLGFLLIILIVKMVSGPSQPAGPTVDEQKRQQEAKLNAEFKSYMDGATSQVKEKKWKEAGLNVQLALKLRPGDKIALDYKEHIEREKAASRALLDAVDFLEQKQYEKAMVLVNQIPSASQYFSEATRLKTEISEKITVDLLEKGKKFMEEKQYAQAVHEFDKILRRDIDNQVAAELKQQSEEQLGIQKKRISYLETQKKRKKRKRITPKPKKERTGLTGQMLTFYRNGEIDKAIQKAEDAGASKSLVKLKTFRGVFKKGMELSKNIGKSKKSIEFLNRAAKLDKEIAGGSGKYRDLIRKRLAKTYFVKGVDAQMGHRYPEAFQSFTRAKKFGNDRAQQRLHDLEKTAKKLYEEAYVIKSTNAEQAIKKLNTVLKIIPPSHVYYSKAKRLRTNIQGPIGSESSDDSGF
jgi:pSer/pThr/pTyr-binding forkhead associated (FHA) protein